MTLGPGVTGPVVWDTKTDEIYPVSAEKKRASRPGVRRDGQQRPQMGLSHARSPGCRQSPGPDGAPVRRSVFQLRQPRLVEQRPAEPRRPCGAEHVSHAGARRSECVRGARSLQWLPMGASRFGDLPTIAARYTDAAWKAFPEVEFLGQPARKRLPGRPVLYVHLELGGNGGQDSQDRYREDVFIVKLQRGDAATGTRP